MADNTISVEELLELAKDGADIKTQPKPMAIERFDELLQKLEMMIAQDAKRTAADLARSQTQLEVLATLQSLVKKAPARGDNVTPPVDLAPLHKILAEIQQANAERAGLSYQFDIQRSAEGGPMQRVIATAIQPTKH